MKTEVPDLEKYPVERPQTHYYDTEAWYLHVDWTDNDGNAHLPTSSVPADQLICHSRRIEFWDRYMRRQTRDYYVE